MCMDATWQHGLSLAVSQGIWACLSPCANGPTGTCFDLASRIAAYLKLPFSIDAVLLQKPEHLDHARLLLRSGIKPQCANLPRHAWGKRRWKTVLGLLCALQVGQRQAHCLVTLQQFHSDSPDLNEHPLRRSTISTLYRSHPQRSFSQNVLG